MTADDLGCAMRERRAELGLRQVDVTARGGPSTETLRHIEKGRNGQGGRLRDSTLGQIDRALSWAPGSAYSLLRDGRPAEPQAAHDLAPAACQCNELRMQLAQVRTIADLLRTTLGDGR